MDAGRNFLTENAKKPDVATTKSGLQYKILRNADGPKPPPNSEVEVNYKGTLIDGKVFDSSYERGESISFMLSQVIPGWSEGVQLMPVGSMFEFYIPFELAYGPAGIPGVIPPHSTLIFQVELLKIY